MIRAQYHFRPSPQGLLAWDVRRLVTLSHGLPVIRVPLTAIRDLDEDHWYAHGPVAPTCRSIVEHCRLIADADLACPIILDAAGRVMDGMHRACRALLEGRTGILAVQFSSDPPPDYIGREPGSLPYD